MSFEMIEVSTADGITTIALNRPEVVNALNSQMRKEITKAMSVLPEGTRCVVLTGNGRGFCSGQDLTDAQAGVDLQATLRDEYEPMLWSIRRCSVPVIAAVSGVAAGAGANLALAADVVIATDDTVFLQAFTKIGLIPDAGGTFILPRLVGQARAAGMMLFADKVSGREAADAGMIWEAVPADDFAATVKRRALHLANGPTAAFLAVREALEASATNDLSEQLKVEARLQADMGKSHDFREGVQAFIEKRAPQFRGN